MVEIRTDTGPSRKFVTALTAAAEVSDHPALDEGVDLPEFPPAVTHFEVVLPARQMLVELLDQVAHRFEAWPQPSQFPRLRAARKHFVDTIKLIAYRAETALVGILREKLARHDDGRALVRELMRTTADRRPDPEHKTLTVHLHPLTSRLQDTAVRHLAEELTATETQFPGTDWRLVFTLPGSS